MATLLIRDLPDEIHERLVSSAQAARRSKEKQAMFLIESGLRRRKPHKEVADETRRLHAQFKKQVSLGDVLKWTEAAH